MNPCTIILFGATGDLAARKLIPAIHDLIHTSGGDYRLVGVAHDELTAQEMLERARPHVRELDEKAWQVLSEKTQYVHGDFADAKLYKKLSALLDDSESRLLYLATSSEFFVPITKYALKYGVMHRQDADEAFWHRIAYEKPFGRSGDDALKIEKDIRALLPENQIYRVDHFLAKKAVVAFPVARMLDEAFNELWVNGNIESIQVIMNEKSGINLRGRYYDGAGAIQDMVQNHVLQAVALLLVDSPVLDYPDLCHEKKKVLARLSIADAVLGQYEGYEKESFVASGSMTETFIAARVAVDAPRWNEVAIFVKTGKMVATQKLVIYVKFKSNDPDRIEDMPMAVVAFSDNSVALVIGREEVAEAVHVTEGPNPDSRDQLDAYGRVLELIVQGDRTLFVSFEEIAEMWRITDALVAQKLPVHSYAPQTNGPKELEAFCKRNNMEWIL